MIFIPKLFVVLGFITILATPRIQDDPPRVLTLNNSGLDSKNITLFYADLVGKFMNFSVSGQNRNELFGGNHLKISLVVPLN